jgi:hypothetical protein
LKTFASFLEILSTCYYESYGFAIYAISEAICPLGCSMVVVKQTEKMLQLSPFFKVEPTYYSSFFNGPTTA